MQVYYSASTRARKSLKVEAVLWLLLSSSDSAMLAEGDQMLTGPSLRAAALRMLAGAHCVTPRIMPNAFCTFPVPWEH